MLAAKAVVLVGGVGSSVVIARELGPDGRGLIAVAIGFVLILAQIGSLGMQTANPYFYGRDDVSRAVLISNAIWLASTVGTLLVGAAVLTRLVAPEVVAGLNWLELILASTAVPAILVMTYVQGLLLVEGRSIAFNAIEAGSSAITVCGLLAAAAFEVLSITTAVVITVGGYGVGALACLVALGGHRSLRRPDLPLVRRMVGYAGRVYLISLMSYAVVRIDLLLLNGFLGATEAGYYSLAVALSDMVYLLPIVVSLNLFPRLTRGRANAETTAELVRCIAPLFAIVVLLVALCAEPVTRILYGEQFARPTAELFWWLALGAWCIGTQSVLNAHLAARGAPAELVIFWAVALAFNVVMNILLLPIAGAFIAPLAASLTYALLLFGHLRLFVKEIGSWSALVPRPQEVVRFVRTAIRLSPPVTSD